MRTSFRNHNSNSPVGWIVFPFLLLWFVVFGIPTMVITQLLGWLIPDKKPDLPE